jgi:general secretion pathway protein A
MYEEYWGLKEKPFENTADPRFFYCSSQHEEALMRLLYAAREAKAAVMLCGECGSGKTLLSRVLLNRLSQEEKKYLVALIVNPAISAVELIEEIVYQLDTGNSFKTGRKSELLRNLNIILEKAAGEGRHSVIVIDEAQAISDERIFEELRLLLNFQLNEKFLFTLVLLGQPELRAKIEKFPQFRQRLALSYYLTALDEAETVRYIQHRCKVAGANRLLFSQEVYGLIYSFSKGIPRQINNICDMALVIAMGEKKSLIGPEVIKGVIRDFQEARDISKGLNLNG